MRMALSTLAVVAMMFVSVGTQAIYTPENGVSAPRVVKKVRPVYPKAAKDARRQGTVILECVVQNDGTVGDVSVTRSLDRQSGLDDAAIAAVRQYRFEPGSKDGHPVAVRVPIEITFTAR